MLYCFVTPEGKYIALDADSGGYPYITDYPLAVHLFATTEEANKYKASFANYPHYDISSWELKEFKGLMLAEPNSKHHSELTRLLASATTAHKDFSKDYQDVMVTIGKGMFWSKEFDMAARELAKKIDTELNYFNRG